MGPHRSRMAYQSHALSFIACALESLGGKEASSVKGATIQCTNGNEIIDLASGGFGYQHPYVIERAKEQLSQMPLSGRVFFSRPLAMLTKKIAELTPGKLSTSYPCNSPAEAIEGALKMARGYHKKRNQVVSVEGSFHGSTMGALSVCGRTSLREISGDFTTDVSFVAYGDVQSLKKIITEKTAAFILEPVMTKTGITLPPAGYLKEVRKICSSTKTLLIFDETVTGLGHCGKWFAGDESNVVPDILVIGNTLGGGILPGGAYITTEKINKKVYGRHHPAMHGSTTGGNPLMSASALAALETIENNCLHLIAAEHGKTLQRTLQHFAGMLPEFIISYEVCGLLASIEVRDKETAVDFQKQAMAQGVAVSTSFSEQKAWIMINAPLIISAMELKKGLVRFENVILNMKNLKLKKSLVPISA